MWVDITGVSMRYIRVKKSTNRHSQVNILTFRNNMPTAIKGFNTELLVGHNLLGLPTDIIDR